MHVFLLSGRVGSDQVRPARRNACNHSFSPIQVTCEYSFKDGACIPKRVHTVVISVQHDEHIQLENMREILMNSIIKEVIPAKYMDENTIFHLQVRRSEKELCLYR